MKLLWIILIVVTFLVLKCARFISEIYRTHKLVREIRKEVNPK